MRVEGGQIKEEDFQKCVYLKSLFASILLDLLTHSRCISLCPQVVNNSGEKGRLKTSKRVTFASGWCSADSLLLPWSKGGQNGEYRWCYVCHHWSGDIIYIISCHCLHNSSNESRDETDNGASGTGESS